jgi:phosphate transport system substrate-binding protein
MRKKIAKFALTLGFIGILAACGAKSFDSSKSISVTTREDGSGTKSAFMELIGLKGQSDVSNVVVATGTAAVMQEVAGNYYALAYDSLGYVTSDVKKLEVDGVEATTANIKSGTYAISRPLSVIYKAAPVSSSALDASYLTFLKSSDAQTIISNNGYVSLTDAATAYTANGSLSGTIEVSGSTSLQPLMILLAAQYEASQAHVTVEVSGGGTGTGYTNAENGVSAFGMISAEFDATKAPDCVSSIVAKDGIAVIVNPSNPLTSVSKTELKNIYDNTESDATKIKTWSQLMSA